jgi:hypothetical protein
MGIPRFRIAEITNGTDIELKVGEIPTWFQKYVLEKLNS